MSYLNNKQEFIFLSLAIYFTLIYLVIIKLNMIVIQINLF